MNNPLTIAGYEFRMLGERPGDYGPLLNLEVNNDVFEAYFTLGCTGTGYGIISVAIIGEYSLSILHDYINELYDIYRKWAQQIYNHFNNITCLQTLQKSNYLRRSSF